MGNFVLILHCDFLLLLHIFVLVFFYFPYLTLYHICHCTAIFYIVCVDNVPHFFLVFCCVLVGCLVSYCAYFSSLVFSLYYNFFSWKNFISGKLCANIAPQFYSFPQNVLKRHEPKHLANGERNNNLQNGQKIVVTPYLHPNLKPIG